MKQIIYKAIDAITLKTIIETKHHIEIWLISRYDNFNICDIITTENEKQIITTILGTYEKN